MAFFKLSHLHHHRRDSATCPTIIIKNSNVLLPSLINIHNLFSLKLFYASNFLLHTHFHTFNFPEKNSLFFSTMAPPKSSSSKHSKKTQDSTLHPVHELNGPMIIGNQQYVPEPPNERDKECIYKSQVLIPVLVSGICHAMLGQLPNPDIKPDRLKEFFPHLFPY
jgi:hypothetical protein